MKLVDNAIVRRAVASFAAQPNQATTLEVLRSCMFGDLLLDTTGSDAPTANGFAPGARLQIRRGAGPESCHVDLAAGRIDRQQVLDLLKQDAPLLLGVDETSQPGKMGFRATAMPDGSPGLFAFTSAPEVPAHNPADAVMASTTTMAIEIARKDGYGGLVINPCGPYLAVTLAELDA